jgi:hypothetical protein
VQNNWALKLGNLKRLKQAVQNYLTYTLKVPYERINDVLLGNIARKGDPADVIKLLEIVFLVILKCDLKEKFIRKIMQLDEKHQFSMMLFIKKILNHEDDWAQEEEINNKEIEILKSAKNNLMKQISELQKEVGHSNQLRDGFQKENEELKLANAQLQNEIDSLSSKVSNTSTEIFSKLEKKLNEKTHMLELSKQIMESTRRELEQENSRLKDELDIALSNSHKVGYYESVLEKYKKKIESLSSLKKKNQELKKSNEQMQQLIKKHQHDSDYNLRAKVKIRQLKQELSKEKNSVELLSISVDCKEKQNRQLQNLITELKEKIIFLENYCEELKNQSSDSSSIDSKHSNHENDLETARKRLIHMYSERPNSRLDCAENLMKENNRLHVMLDFAHKKKQAKKENVQMIYEELLTRQFLSDYQIIQLRKNNEVLVRKVEDLSEEKLENQVLSQNMQIIKMEIENYKQKNEELLEGIKKSHSEKDEVFIRCIETKDLLMEARSKVSEKEILLNQLNIELKVLQEKVKMMEDQNNLYKKEIILEGKTPNFELNEKMDALKEELIKLQLMNSKLEKEKKMIIEEKDETIQLIKKSHEETLNKLNHENIFRSEQMIRDTEKAITKIQNDKEQIQAKLQFVRKSSIRELRNTLIIKDPFVAGNDENRRIKLQLSEHIKENEKLLRDNQELLICWKESAFMVRELKKSMDMEAKRMQDLLKIRQSYNN